MNNYNYLENYYSESLSNDHISQKLLNEFDLSSLSDKFKESISKLNLPNANKLFKKIEKTLSNKLIEFDVDPKEIKKKANISSKEIHAIINEGYLKKIPSKKIASKIENKIISSISSQIQNSAASGIKIIFTLIISVAVMLFIMGAFVALLNIIGINIYISYIIVLFFIFEVYELSFKLTLKMFNEEVNDTMVTYRSKFTKVSINKFDEFSNQNIYAMHLFLESFKNIIKRLNKVV